MQKFLKHLIAHFRLRPKYPKTAAAKDVAESRAMREHLTEQEIDKTLKDSFPASDPPPWH
jgi:hypothetical protein